MLLVLSVLFSAACFCPGSADTVSKGLLKRIEALEARDAQQASRIDQLEQRSISYHREIQALNEAKKALKDDIIVMSVESKQKDKNLSKLEKNIKDLMLTRREDEGVIKTLRHEITILERKISEMDNSLRDYQRKSPSLNHHKNKKYRKTREHKTVDLNSPQKETETRKTFIKNAMDQILNRTSNVEHKNVVFTPQTANKSVHTGKQLIKKQATSDIVAFHAVVSPHSVDHLGSNENIKFDHTLLNLGGGYHYQHGIFIAPKSGIYLISVSVASNIETEFVADILKDGTKLAGVLGRSEEYYTQSAVTIVTQMDAGNEIWVAHTHPTDGTIWGNYYSSFAGFLLTET